MLRRTSLLLSIVLVVHFSFLCFIQPVNARTTTVPDGSSKTIQDAVDQAAPGTPSSSRQESTPLQNR